MAPPDTIPAMLAARVAADPDALAVTTLDDRGLTYATVLARSMSVGGVLDRTAGGDHTRVGVYAHNSPAWVVASLAVWSRGSSVAAVGAVLSEAEAAMLFSLAGVRTVITTEPATELTGRFDIVRLDEAGALAVPTDAPAPHGRLPRPGDEACVLFTSGTTGAPKGIPHTHGDLMASARQTVDAYARHARFRPRARPERPPAVQFNPYGHHGGYVSLAVRLWTGRTLVLVPKFSVDAVVTATSRYQLESLQLTPTAIYMLATADEPVDLSGVRYATSGTAPLSPDAKRRFEQRFGIPVLSTYGMSETGPICQLRLADIDNGAAKDGAVGRPSTGVEVRIVDGEGHDVADGGEGEIVVRTPLSTRSYVGDSVVASLDGWFRTGDIGRVDGDGFVFVTGRTGDKVIVGGFNVYPGEVENAIVASGLAAQAVVVGFPDERLGEVPVAGVVWSGPADEAALVSYLRDRLAHYKVPRRFAPLDAIPATERGKVDRVVAAAWARSCFGSERCT